MSSLMEQWYVQETINIKSNYFFFRPLLVVRQELLRREEPLLEEFSITAHKTRVLHEHMIEI